MIKIGVIGPESIFNPSKTELELESALNEIALNRQFSGKKFSVITKPSFGVCETAKEQAMSRGWDFSTEDDLDNCDAFVIVCRDNRTHPSAKGLNTAGKTIVRINL